jgi:hypothetical protein
MNGSTPSKLKPALIGGVALGAASAIPPISWLNCACCALVIGGGVLAVYLYLKDQPPAPQPPYGDGAILGLMAGAIGAVVATILTIPVQMIMASFMDPASQTAQMKEAFSQLDMPPALEQFLLNMASPSVNATKLLLALGFNLVIFSIFALIGGIIGVAIFHKKGKPYTPAPIEPPPPPRMNV